MVNNAGFSFCLSRHYRVLIQKNLKAVISIGSPREHESLCIHHLSNLSILKLQEYCDVTGEGGGGVIPVTDDSPVEYKK